MNVLNALVSVQALVRGFLARRRCQRIQNGGLNLFSDQQRDHGQEEIPIMITDFCNGIQDGNDVILEPTTEGFENVLVASVLEQCGEFEYTDI